MPAPFAALEARVNDAVIGRLANREATFIAASGALPVAVMGIFDAEYGSELEQMAGGVSPAFTVKVTDLPDVARGASLVIGLVEYEVVEPMPDGAGFVVLRLRKA